MLRVPINITPQRRNVAIYFKLESGEIKSRPSDIRSSIHQNAVVLYSTIQNALVIIVPPSKGNNMTPQKESDDPQKKRIIEFDMLLPDLEPEEEENVWGGGKTGEQQTSEGRKTEP